MIAVGITNTLFILSAFLLWPTYWYLSIILRKVENQTGRKTYWKLLRFFSLAGIVMPLLFLSAGTLTPALAELYTIVLFVLGLVAFFTTYGFIRIIRHKFRFWKQFLVYLLYLGVIITYLPSFDSVYIMGQIFNTLATFMIGGSLLLIASYLSEYRVIYPLEFLLLLAGLLYPLESVLRAQTFSLITVQTPLSFELIDKGRFLARLFTTAAGFLALVGMYAFNKIVIDFNLQVGVKPLEKWDKPVRRRAKKRGRK